MSVQAAVIGDFFYDFRIGDLTLWNPWGFLDIGKGLWTLQDGCHREQGWSCSIGRSGNKWTPGNSLMCIVFGINYSTQLCLSTVGRSSGTNICILENVKMTANKWTMLLCNNILNATRAPWHIHNHACTFILMKNAPCRLTKCQNISPP